MLRRCPVRIARSFKNRKEKNEPLLTGQRVLDTFFPLVKGGSAIIPVALEPEKQSHNTRLPNGLTPMWSFILVVANAAMR